MRPLRKAVLVTVATVVVAVLLETCICSAAVAVDHRHSAKTRAISEDAGDRSLDSTVHSEPGAHRRTKRTLLKLKPIVKAMLLPAKLVLGPVKKLVGAKALKAKVVGAGVGLKVAKVAVKAATSLGIKALLLNFLFQKINQIIDFKTRLLSNLDQKNRQQNAQFLLRSQGDGGATNVSQAPSVNGDLQVQAQGDNGEDEDDEPVSFNPNKVSLQVPDRLFGPSFTAVNGISQTIGTVIQNTASRLARFIEALKPLLWKTSRLTSSSSGAKSGDSDSAASSDAVVADSSDLDFVEMDALPVSKASSKVVTAKASSATSS
ncbi:uncharacterized protein LOC126836608 [Adelges cooleyi]|uniref:uncharacterized protein LOC126836608 n=1 Tax=Adelges cooleyi TaxID=133065 RepID=UPI0021802DFD|nr:uncharacterized protein LOC126836608 [Adelges cooleyi]